MTEQWKELFLGLEDVFHGMPSLPAVSLEGTPRKKEREAEEFTEAGEQTRSLEMKSLGRRHRSGTPADEPSPYETARAIRKESEAMFRL